MASYRKLDRFDIREVEEGYVFSIKDDQGTTTEVLASEDQIDELIETLDEILGEDDAD